MCKLSVCTVLHACSFPLLTFPPEFDPWQGGLGNLKAIRLILVGWSSCGPMWQVRNLKVSSRCQVVAAEYTLLFQVWRRNISIPEKPVYSVWRYLTLPVQIPHPNQASFRSPFPQFKVESTSASLGGLLCQIPYTPVAYDSQITVGCPPGGGRGRGMMLLRMSALLRAF